MLALVTVGQTPRPDLEDLFGKRVNIRLVGALDGLSSREIAEMRPEPAGYPILCRLADGTTTLVERTRLTTHVQCRLAELPPGDVTAAMVLCTADFPELTTPYPLIVPGRVLPNLVRSMTAARRIGVVTSNPGQIVAAERKWSSFGFLPYVVADDPANGRDFREVALELREQKPDLTVLDCFGHDQRTKDAVAGVLGTEVVVAREVMAAMALPLVGG
jgi:protein AroM